MRTCAVAAAGGRGFLRLLGAATAAGRVHSTHSTLSIPAIITGCHHQHHNCNHRYFSTVSAASSANIGNLGNHDLGGALDELEAGGVHPGAAEEDTAPQMWELRTHALLGLMVGKKRTSVTS